LTQTIIKRETEHMTYRNSNSFVGVVNNDAEGAYRIKLAREKISEVNSQLRANGSRTRCRLVVKGRLGKNNPNARHYRRGGKYWHYSSIDIRSEHATRFDIYVYRRYS
jgi:hypothetical protein